MTLAACPYLIERILEKALEFEIWQVGLVSKQYLQKAREAKRASKLRLLFALHELACTDREIVLRRLSIDSSLEDMRCEHARLLKERNQRVQAEKAQIIISLGFEMLSNLMQH